MKITMAMIFDGLCRRFTCVKGPFYASDYPVMAVFTEASESLRRGEGCYVIDDIHGGVPSWIPPEAFVFAGDAQEPPRSYAIWVTDENDRKAVRDAIAEVISYYTGWADELLNLTIHGAGLEELIDFAHHLFGNPMTIIDHNYRVLAHTQQDVMDDSLWVASRAESATAEEFQDLVASEKDAEDFELFLERLRRNGEIFYHTTSIGTSVSACVARVMQSGLAIVNVVQKNRPVTQGDFDCLRYFSSIVGTKIRAIEFTWRSSVRSYDALLQDVVRGNLVGAGEIKSRLGEAWIDTLSYFTVFVVDSRKGLARYHELCSIEDDLAVRFPEARGVIHARTLVLFVNHESPIVNIDTKALEDYLQSHNLVAGMSDSCGIEVSLHDLVYQAQIALRIGRWQFPNDTIFEFCRCRPYYLFDLCCRRGDQNRFIHPCLAQIAEHDASAGVMLMPTLRSLVHNYGNRFSTAKDLGIQRNTLQYRLEKIESMCSVDFSDEAVFDHICLSVRLLEYYSINFKHGLP